MSFCLICKLCGLSNKRLGKIGHHVHHVAASSQEVGALRHAFLIVEEQAKGLFAHLVKACAHEVGGAVGREYADALQASFGVEAVNVVEVR